MIKTQDITNDDRLWILFGYIFAPIIPIMILFMEDKQNRPFIKMHNAQALMLGEIEWAINFLLSFIVIGIVTAVLTIIFNVYLGIRASHGLTVKIPFITNFVRKQGWA